MRTVWPRWVAGLIAVGLLLSGCGGDSPEPKPLPKESKSSPSASPSATPPVMPAAAKKKTKAGAVAVARTFLDALNFAGATGDTDPLRGTYTQLCTRCEVIADGIDKTYREGGKIEGGAWHPTRFKFYGIENQVAVVDAAVDYDAQTWTKRSGAKPTKFPASQGNLKAFHLRWTGSRWAVSALDPNA